MQKLSRCLAFAAAAALFLNSTCSFAGLVVTQVNVTATNVGGNAVITAPYAWTNAVGSEPTISMVSITGGGIAGIPMVSDIADIMGVTFKVPASPSNPVIDKVAWGVAFGGGAANYTARLVNLGTADPNTAYNVAGTDLLNGGNGLANLFSASPNSQIDIFDFTGSDEVSLVPGNTYVFELVRDTTNANNINFARTGGANSTYADGQYWKNRTGGSSAGSRDGVVGVYLTTSAVPEASSFLFGGTLATLVGLCYGYRTLRRKA